MDKSKNLHGHLFALTANVMWGLMAPIGKSALQEFSALSVTTFRMIGAAAAFWMLSIFCKQEHVNHRDMLKIFFASLFALVFNQGIFIFGLSMTSPNYYFADSNHDCGCHLSERTDYKQEGIGNFCRCYGGTYPYFK
jgi:drug/metabolite transporter (DMT)-like permease